MNSKVRAIIERFHGEDLDAHYLAYFECFNGGLFFEAHEVLEKIWLPRRKESDGLFYKGLIQLAGAFVHLQKGRLRPAGALFELARTNLERYGPVHERLDLERVLEMLKDWRFELERNGFLLNPIDSKELPTIKLR